MANLGSLFKKPYHGYVGVILGDVKGLPGHLPETWNIVKDGKDTDTNHVDLGPSICT